jgi:hypothetical protein
MRTMPELLHSKNDHGCIVLKLALEEVLTIFNTTINVVACGKVKILRKNTKRSKLNAQRE